MLPQRVVIVQISNMSRFDPHLVATMMIPVDRLVSLEGEREQLPIGPLRR
jgi:hypothetical protein